MIKITVNEIPYEVPSDLTIMEACKRIGIYIPSLCFHSDVPSGGTCGLCIVKVNGSSYTHACTTHITPGMIINTVDADIIEKQKIQFENFMDVYHSPKTADIEEVTHYFYPKKNNHIRQSEKTNSISFNSSACINCQICERICADIIDVGALNDPTISLNNGKCVSCGLCTSSCPTNALVETSSIPIVLSNLVNAKVVSYLIVDPSVLVSINDAFSEDNKNLGLDCTEKIVGAARLLGFKFIFDNRMANDFLALEMTEELFRRIQSNSGLPIINSNCPSVISDIEKSSRELISNLSIIKPPQHILSRTIRKSFPKLTTETIFIVHLTSCVGSKSQIKRMQLANEIDATITAREFVQLINSFGIEWSSVKPSQFDGPFTTFSGASSLTAISGGLTTSILRTLYDKTSLGSESSRSVSEYSYDIDLNGYNRIERRTHKIKVPIKGKIEDFDLNVAVCNGLSAFHQLTADKDAMKQLHFIEVMACPGGCVFGGGQPKIKSREFTMPRINSIKEFDKNNPIESAFKNISDVEMNIYLPLYGLVQASPTKSPSNVSNYTGPFGTNTKSIKNARSSLNISGSVSKTGIKAILRPNVENQNHSIGFGQKSQSCDFPLNSLATNNDNFIINTTTHYEPHETATLHFSRKSLSTLDLPLIAYGSSTGRAMQLARYVASFFKSSSSTLNSISLEKIKMRKKIIIVISTLPNGDFPINSKKFIEELIEAPRDLSEVSYAILGIDDHKEKELFGKSAIKLDEMLLKLKATPIIPLTKIDISGNDRGESGYAKWLSDLKDALLIDKEPMFGMNLINKFKKVEDVTIATKPSRPIGYEMAEISERILLTPPEFSPKLTKVIITLPEGLAYELGDNVQILPCNDSDIVDAVLNSLGYSKNEVFNISHESALIPDKVTVLQLFTQYLDLNGLPPPGIYQTFYNALMNEENNEEGKKVIEPLLNEEAEERRNFQTEHNAGEAIIELAKYAKPPLDNLVSCLLPMMPRSYSVMSTPDACPGKADLLITEVLFKMGSKERYGLCTHFLASPESSKIAVHFRRGKFRYPKDLSSDMIFIGLGSGLSPILPLVQYREKLLSEGKKLGKALLFFGARYKGSYQRLMDRIDVFHKKGAITDFYLAFSRDPEKQHVQDLMKKNSEKIWDIWQDPRTCVFFGGPNKGIPEQLKEIMLDITIHEGWMAMEEAMAYNSRHEWYIEGD